MTIQELEKLLQNREGQNLEFKAKSSFSDDELFDYCAALANEGGGFLIFGIDNASRSVVGTNLFRGTLQLSRTDTECDQRSSNGRGTISS